MHWRSTFRSRSGPATRDRLARDARIWVPDRSDGIGSLIYVFAVLSLDPDETRQGLLRYIRRRQEMAE
jgi:hypothetical protein